MKLYLVSAVLLLLSAGYADLAPSTGQSPTLPPGVKVTAKLLYDGEYIISEMHGPRKLYYRFWAGGPVIRLQTYNPDGREESMDIPDAWRKAGRAFAIETFSYYRGFWFDCKKHVEKGVDCKGNVIVRNLTSEEKEQLRQLKDEATKGTFKLVYSNGTMLAKSFGIDQIDMSTEHRVDGFSFHLNSIQAGYMWLLHKNLLESSFTIEALPEESKNGECYGKHPYLEPVSCRGKFTIY